MGGAHLREIQGGASSVKDPSGIDHPLSATACRACFTVAMQLSGLDEDVALTPERGHGSHGSVPLANGRQPPGRSIERAPLRRLDAVPAQWAAVVVDPWADAPAGQRHELRLLPFTVSRAVRTPDGDWWIRTLDLGTSPDDWTSPETWSWKLADRRLAAVGDPAAPCWEPVNLEGQPALGH